MERNTRDSALLEIINATGRMRNAAHAHASFASWLAQGEGPNGIIYYIGPLHVIAGGGGFPLVPLSVPTIER
jgi:hypothetical protein